MKMSIWIPKKFCQIQRSFFPNLNWYKKLHWIQINKFHKNFKEFPSKNSRHFFPTFILYEQSNGIPNENFYKNFKNILSKFYIFFQTWICMKNPMVFLIKIWIRIAKNSTQFFSTVDLYEKSHGIPNENFDKNFYSNGIPRKYFDNNSESE